MHIEDMRPRNFKRLKLLSPKSRKTKQQQQQDADIGNSDIGNSDRRNPGVALGRKRILNTKSPIEINSKVTSERVSKRLKAICSKF